MSNPIKSIINNPKLNAYSEKHKAKIVDLNIGRHKAIGEYLIITFDFVDKNKIHHQLEKFISYKNNNSQISNYFTKFINTFFSDESANPLWKEELIGKKCFITINTFGFTRITQIDPA